MRNLRSSYDKIPKPLRKPLLQWGLPFLIGWIITQFWGIATLFAILIFVFTLFYLIAVFGSKRARIASEWSIKEYLKRIRGMLIFALLPAAWELIKKPSAESLIAIIVIIFVAATIWQRFDEAIEDVTSQLFGRSRSRTRSRARPSPTLKSRRPKGGSSYKKRGRK